MNDGGSAFPVPGNGIMSDIQPSEGMTLRDWFAGQALTRVDWHTLDYQAARQCYDMADAMLAEREKRDG